ncbi:unnamed protein product [Prorocentrum cordatum]|uniref:Uncharacterized protein n=1 Tax=Prorocentrum cordatum TaxID=2364126 RepID=A0ABN9TT19_9DINO|nr:unnamed protein product [Polarella glacialis]
MPVGLQLSSSGWTSKGAGGGKQYTAEGVPELRSLVSTLEEMGEKGAAEHYTQLVRGLQEASRPMQPSAGAAKHAMHQAKQKQQLEAVVRAADELQVRLKSAKSDAVLALQNSETCEAKYHVAVRALAADVPSSGHKSDGMARHGLDIEQLLSGGSFEIIGNDRFGQEPAGVANAVAQAAYNAASAAQAQAVDDSDDDAEFQRAADMVHQKASSDCQSSL